MASSCFKRLAIQGWLNQESRSAPVPSERMASTSCCFAAADRAGMHRLHRADDGHLLAVEQIFDGFELAVVFVAAREVVEHVAQRVHAELAQRLRVARTDALQHGQVGVEGGRRGGGLPARGGFGSPWRCGAFFFHLPFRLSILDGGKQGGCGYRPCRGSMVTGWGWERGARVCFLVASGY